MERAATVRGAARSFALGFGALPLVEAGAINISEFASLIP